MFLNKLNQIYFTFAAHITAHLTLLHYKINRLKAVNLGIDKILLNQINKRY